MKGILCKEIDQFLLELHDDRKFEIFTALEGVPKSGSKPIRRVMNLDDIDDDADTTIDYESDPRGSSPDMGADEYKLTAIEGWELY